MKQKFDEIYFAMHLPSIDQKSSQKKDTDIAKKILQYVVWYIWEHSSNFVQKINWEE